MINFKNIQKIVGKTVLPLTGENQKVILRKPSETLFEAGSPENGPSDNPTEFRVNATIIPVKQKPSDAAASVSKAQIMILVDGAISEAPQVGWVAITGGLEYRVMDVSTTKPGKTVLLHKLKCGR